jgi:hypothetical protein
LDFDRKPVTAMAPGVSGDANVYTTSPGRLRHKKFDRLPEKFLAVIAEQLFRMRVYQDDLPLVVHQYHGAGGSFDSP